MTRSGDAVNLAVFKPMVWNTPPVECCAAEHSFASFKKQLAAYLFYVHVTKAIVFAYSVNVVLLTWALHSFYSFSLQLLS